MCLLVLAWRAHPRYQLIVAANRDEFHERPAASMARWPGAHGIVAGRDLRAGGTWLGADARGRFGIITNFRDLQRPRPGAPSRGALIPSYLEQEQGPQQYLAALSREAAHYSGFNLLLTDPNGLWYASNRAGSFARELTPGVYGLSNHLLDTPWPKLVRVRQLFDRLLSTQELLREDLFAMLADRAPAARDSNAPPSHLPADLDRALSAPFVLHSTYGTRCSTIVLQDSSGDLCITERRFDAAGDLAGEVSFDIAPTGVRSVP